MFDFCLYTRNWSLFVMFAELDYNIIRYNYHRLDDFGYKSLDHAERRPLLVIVHVLTVNDIGLVGGMREHWLL